jgi:hypothetical protein
MVLDSFIVSLVFLLNISPFFFLKRGHAESTREKVGGKCFQIAINNMSMAM